MWFPPQLFGSSFYLYAPLTSLQHHTFLIFTFRVNQISFLYLSYPLHHPMLWVHHRIIFPYKRLMSSAYLFHFSPALVLHYLYMSSLSLLPFSFKVHYFDYHWYFKQLMTLIVPSSPPTIPLSHAGLVLPSRWGLETYHVPHLTFLSTFVFIQPFSHPTFLKEFKCLVLLPKNHSQQYKSRPKKLLVQHTKQQTFSISKLHSEKSQNYTKWLLEFQCNLPKEFMCTIV
jgi:hypothetical protein